MEENKLINIEFDTALIAILAFEGQIALGDLRKKLQERNRAEGEYMTSTDYLDVDESSEGFDENHYTIFRKTSAFDSAVTEINYLSKFIPDETKVNVVYKDILGDLFGETTLSVFNLDKSQAILNQEIYNYNLDDDEFPEQDLVSLRNLISDKIKKQSLSK